MPSSNASGSKLAELEEKLDGLEEQKAAVLNSSEIGPRDLILLGELNKDLDRTQAAITALSSGELHFPVSASAILFSVVWPYVRAFSWLALHISRNLAHRKCLVVAMHLHVQEVA